MRMRRDGRAVMVSAVILVGEEVWGGESGVLWGFVFW